MGKFILYGLEASPPVRAVLLTLKSLNLPYEYKHLDLFKGEHLTAEFLAINPQHTVPAFLDDDVAICESHAINAYLIRKYAKNDALYPEDYVQRALVDQRLHFDSCVMYRALRNISERLFFHNENQVPQHKIDSIHTAYGFLETFLEKQPYVAGEQMTIADFCLISTVTCLVALVDVDVKKYPKVTAWMERLKKLPYYEEANGKGAKDYFELIKMQNVTIVP